MAAAFTLVEVMIAMVILTGVAFAVMTTLAFASRAARINTNAITAKNIAQGYFERMAIDDFADVNATNYPDIDYSSADPVWLDKGLNIRCKVEFAFKGFGQLSSATTSQLTDSSANWTADEWAGNVVFIVSGAGAGQFSRISSNTATELNLVDAFDVSPGSGARYMINNGKTVQITTTWQYLGKAYSQSVESLVTNFRNSSDLGF